MVLLIVNHIVHFLFSLHKTPKKRGKMFFEYLSSSNSPQMYVEKADPSDNTWSALIRGCITSVCYTDIPIVLMAIFHFLNLMIMIFSRKHTYLSTIYFAGIVFLIAMTPSLNNYMMSNWDKYGFSFCYFDESMAFILIFWAFPLTICCLVMIITLLIDIIRQYIVGKVPEKANLS